MANAIDLDKTFEETLRTFDFKKVQKVMKFLKWTWHNNTEPPTIKEMKDVVTDLFNSAIKCSFIYNIDRGSSGTGGFEVSVQRYKINQDDDEYEYEVKIQFIIEDNDYTSEEIKEIEEDKNVQKEK